MVWVGLGILIMGSSFFVMCCAKDIGMKRFEMIIKLIPVLGVIVLTMVGTDKKPKSPEGVYLIVCLIALGMLSIYLWFPKKSKDHNITRG